VIAANAGRARTGMTSEALGVSVAPSFFQSCVSDGKTAKMEDVMRFKVSRSDYSCVSSLVLNVCPSQCVCLQACKLLV
jgi:hypothetical protein